MKVIFVIGLPGSGKSYFLSDKIEKIDDIVSLDQIPETFNELYISDINFCFENIRNKAAEYIKNKFNIEPELIFFENNPDQCWKNIQFRNDDRKISKDFIWFLSDKYHIPDDIVPIKIFET